VFSNTATGVGQVIELTVRGEDEGLVAGSAPQHVTLQRTSAVASTPSASGRDGACPGVFSAAIVVWQRIRRDLALLLRDIPPPHAIRAAVVDVSCTPSSLRCFVELDSLQLREDTSWAVGAGRVTGERQQSCTTTLQHDPQPILSSRCALRGASRTLTAVMTRPARTVSPPGQGSISQTHTRGLCNQLVLVVPVRSCTGAATER